MVTLGFFIVLVVTVLVYWLLPRSPVRTGFLTLASLGWIAANDPLSAAVVLALAAYAYFMGNLIAARRTPLVHRLGVGGILAVLAFFKFAGLLDAAVADIGRFAGALPEFHLSHLLLPLGISYITFKYISYLTDIHWKLIAPGKFIDVLCYGSLFTIFAAGPIERYERFGPQLREAAPEFLVAYLDEGLYRIAFGLFKKLVIADWIGYFIDPVWRSPASYDPAIRLLALAGYSIQIYTDFAGYSDIAIGSSRCFGLTIMENFDWPYVQPNISMFWRHWHISLSDWLRDYVFFPLSRVSQRRVWLLGAVPLIAMGLCGLWHGTAWHFILWGLWHGAGIAALQWWRAFLRAHPGVRVVPTGWWTRTASALLTFTFVTAGWLWFRG